MPRRHLQHSRYRLAATLLDHRNCPAHALTAPRRRARSVTVGITRLPVRPPPQPMPMAAPGCDRPRLIEHEAP